MARVRIKVLKNLDKVVNAQRHVKQAAREALHDITDDLVRASSGAAPHKEGVLEKSWAKKVVGSGRYLYGFVGYAVKEGGYDYAVRMHETTYNLGPGSRAKGGGVGMSGRVYPVGPKFLTRPLEGEAKTYRDYLEAKIHQAIGRG
jgi:hypothetical protein